MVDVANAIAAVGAHPNTEDDGARVVTFSDRDTRPNVVLAQHQHALPDWTYGAFDLAAFAQRLRSWSSSLVSEFFPNVSAPEFLFRFEQERPRVLGHYVPGRNDLGLRWEISINPRHLGRPEGEIAAVLLHEVLHWCEEATSTPPRSRNGYHSGWFRTRAAGFGIPCTRYGASLGIAVPSRFSRWAAAHNLDLHHVTRSEVLDPTIQDPRAVPKRVAWVCACPPGELVIVQVARASELRAHCDRCGAPFQRKGEDA